MRAAVTSRRGCRGEDGADGVTLGSPLLTKVMPLGAKIWGAVGVHPSEFGG